MRYRFEIYVMAGLILGGSLAGADVIKKTMGEEKGAFSEYKNSKFMILTDGGGTIEIPKASVRELILDKPVAVSFLRKGKSQRENGELLGYDKLQFKLKQKNKEMSLSAMYITSMQAQVAASSAGGGTAMGDAETVIPAIDTSEFDESVMSAEQKASLETYRSVRRRYDAFIRESSAMVAEMDRSSGQKREELLSKLRIRKNQEQPIRLEMSGAHKALLASFPNGFPLKAANPPPAEPQSVKPPPGESAAEIIGESADSENGEVILIDTAPLAQSGNLTDKQMHALDEYEKAAVAYEQISAKQLSLANAIQAAADADKANLMPLFEAGEKEATSAKARLLKAQKAFLKAFPNLRLTD